MGAPRSPSPPPVPAGPSPFTAASGGVRIAIRLQPGAAREGIEGLGATRDGRPALVVRVRAVPEKGAANEALVRLLADAIGLAPSRLELVGGAKDRHKTILVSGDSAELLARLGEWLSKRPA